MIPIQIEEKEASVPRVSRSCHFCSSRESEDDAWWQIGNTKDTEQIWICWACFTTENVQGWLNSKCLQISN